MTEEFAAFLDAFKNLTKTVDGEDYVMARADYTTNTLRVNEPADDPYGMTLIHALVSREEFMHGEWSVGLVNSLSRLKLAAIDAFYDALDDPSVRDERLQVLYDAWIAAQTVDTVVEPFQEAVDKLQILSVVYGDMEFLANIQETFEAVYGDEYDPDCIYKRLRHQIEYQTEVASGAAHAMDGDALYVNPLYCYALSYATGSADGGGDGRQSVLDQVSDRRSVAETVAQVTLDVPHPIAPLGPDAEFDALCVDDLDVDPIDVGDLKTKYAVDDDALDAHLLQHADEITNDDVRAELGTEADAYDDTWVDHVFVSTLQALTDLEEELDDPIHELHPNDLRRRLTDMVHDVDLETDETMLDRPTPLIEVPSEAASDVPDQDLISVEKEPLPKVLIEAFEQHGSFGAVVFQPTEGENKRQLNYHAVDTDLGDDPDVPVDVDSYQALWEHYFVGKELLNTMLVRRNAYEADVRAAFADAFDDEYALEVAVESVDAPPRPVPDSSANDDWAAPGPDSGLAGRGIDSQSLQETVMDELEDQDIGKDGKSDEIDAADDSDDGGISERMAAAFDEYSLAHLRMAMAKLDEIKAVPLDGSQFEPVDCPLCEVIADPCGGDVCVTTERLASFDDQLPALLERFIELEPQWLR